MPQKQTPKNGLELCDCADSHFAEAPGAQALKHALRLPFFLLGILDFRQNRTLKVHYRIQPTVSPLPYLMFTSNEMCHKLLL